MKKWIRLLMPALIAAAVSRVAFADNEVLHPSAKCSITLHYLDSADGTDPVTGAEFSWYRVAALVQKAENGSVATAYEGLIPGSGGNRLHIDASTRAAQIEEQTARAYAAGTVEDGASGVMRTDTEGTARAANLPQGMYLVCETKPAKEHLASSSFLIAVPYTSEVTEGGERRQRWSFDAEAAPKPLPCGDLIICKVLKGSGAETKRSFHFVVTFSSQGDFHYRRSGGKEGTVRSGSVLALKGGESVVIDTIPAGTGYRVREKEADQDGYSTKVTGASGQIRRTKQARAVFLNEKKAVPGTVKPTAVPGNSPVPLIGGTEPVLRTTSAGVVRTGDEQPVLWLLLLIPVSLFAAGSAIRGFVKRKS